MLIGVSVFLGGYIYGVCLICIYVLQIAYICDVICFSTLAIKTLYINYIPQLSTIISNQCRKNVQSDV